jgi:hypothetical protein
MDGVEDIEVPAPGTPYDLAIKAALAEAREQMPEEVCQECLMAGPLATALAEARDEGQVLHGGEAEELKYLREYFEDEVDRRHAQAEVGRENGRREGRREAARALEPLQKEAQRQAGEGYVAYPRVLAEERAKAYGVAIETISTLADKPPPDTGEPCGKTTGDGDECSLEAGHKSPCCGIYDYPDVEGDGDGEPAPR